MKRTQNYFFIVSTGRTATKFLAKTLNHLHTEIYACHEPKPKLIKLKWEFGVNKISLGKSINKFLLKRVKLLKNINNSIYIESNPYLLFLVPLIERIFSSYKIVHIIRDGRNWVRSALNRGVYTSFLEKLPNLLLKILKSYPISEIWEIRYIRKYFSKFYRNLWRFRAYDFYKDDYKYRWNIMTPFEKLSWMWMKFNQYMYNLSKKNPNIITVHFEAIFDKSREFIGAKKILNFFDLDSYWPDFKKFLLTLAKINKTKNYHVPHWKDWTHETKERFDDIAGNVMRLYNYY